MDDWFSKLPDATIPAWAGFFISTALALVKIWELWQGRFRVDVSGSFAGDERVGNTVYIRNLSPHAVILTHWEVYYAHRYLPFSKRETATERDFDAGDSVIEKTSTHPLHFADEGYFSWSHKKLRGRSIYIKLHFAGRPRISARIYPH